MTRRILLVGGLVAAVLLVALAFLLRGRARGGLEVEVARAAALARSDELAVARADDVRASAGSELHAEADAVPAPQAPPAPAPAATPARPPKDAQGLLRVTVLDARSDQPIPLAAVELIGMRREDEPGSEYVFPEAVRAETDVHGVARLPFPAWVHGLALTRAIDTSVSHPDYVQFRQDLAIGSLEEDHVVRLERGAFLIVSGWIGSRQRVIRDVVPRVEDDAGLEAGSWQPVRDGRPSTSRLAPGPHVLAIHWRDEHGATWHSLPQPFELAAGEQREIELELLAPVTLEAVLDPAVPRPVEDGEVELSVGFGERHGPTTLRTWKARVEADGSFRVDGLPRGPAELIALCDGWVSKRTRVEDAGGARLELTTLVLPAEGPFVVPMEPAATLVVQAVDAADAPVAGAQVHVWPNVHWANGYASIFLDRTWAATTDARGIARIANLPPYVQQGLSLRAEGRRIAGSSGPRPDQLAVDLVSDRTSELRVVLEAGG